MHTYVLEAKNITKRFPGVIANDNICISVEHGEIHGLIGENGAGKSTLLKILNGVYPAGSYDGDIFINGKQVSFNNSLESRKSGIGFVPQEISILDNRTVAENIFAGQLCLRHGLVDQRLMRKKAEMLMEENGILLDAAKTANRLTIGQQQQLMILRALASNPQLLVLDEPTTSLTLPDVSNLFQIIQRLKNRGTSVVLVTHKLSEILEITDRVTVLRDGKNICVLDRKDYSEEIIVSSMIGRSVTNMYAARNFKVGEEVLRVEHLTLEHPMIENRLLLNDVSFSLKKGEVLGISGLIGAGKSETLNAIFGRYKRARANIYLNGIQIKIKNEKDALDMGIALVTEDRKKDGLLFLNDIKRNININNLSAISRCSIVDKQKEKNRAQKMFVSLRVKANSINTYVNTLSGGNQQKVVVARALNREPRILLLDEPTKGVDVGAKNEIYQIINELAGAGVSIILASSDLPELMGMCDRFIVLANGRVSAEMSAAEVSEQAIMLAATV